jgi:hypothetical protein
MTEKTTKRAIGALKRYGSPQASSLFHYVTIHPLADEPALLNRLGVKPENCVAVDCYWALGDEVLFVSVLASHDSETFASFHRKDGSPVERRLHVVTHQVPLTTRTVETILTQLESWYRENKSALPREKLVFTKDDLGVAVG